MTKKLWTTKDIAAAVCEREKISSDYGLAKILGVDQNTAAGWRRGFRVMSDDMLPKVAPLLDDDPAWMALCLAVERVKSDTLADKMKELLLAGANRVALVALTIACTFACLNGLQPIA